MKCGDPNNPGGPYIKSNGDPCGRQVRPGFTRCNLHGGNAPSARIKAEQLMAQARMPAIEALYSIIDQFEKNPCGACGYPIGDSDEKRMVIKAAQTVLDRAGMGPHSTVSMTAQTDGDIDPALLTTDERGELLMHLAAIKEIKTRVRVRQQNILADPMAGTTTGTVTH
jgi:hypothetical protein